jgi:alkylhydroperoxidase family enzyme
VRLRSLAPDVFAAYDVVHATVHRVEPALVDLARATVAGAFGLADPVAAPAGDRAPAVRRFGDQFVVDVASLTDEQRAAALAALGRDAFEFTQLLYVFDWDTRLQAAYRQLFGAEPPSAGDADDPPDAAPSLWEALDTLFRTIARRRALDPLTTELVRLRGARAHNCRLCKSLRNIRPANVGVDEAVYDQLDHFESSDLDERHKVALRFTDALVWQPLDYPIGLVDAVQCSWSDDEAVELLFDVARNAANKIAVALAADTPHVDDGVEYFDTDDAGELVYGLTPAP